MKPFATIPGATLYQSDAADLSMIPDGTVQCCVTSPPYWGLRDYQLPPSVWGGDPDCEHEWAEIVKPAADGTLTPEGNSALRAGNQGDTSATMKPHASGLCTKCGAWNGCLGLEPTPDLFIEHLVDVFREVRRVLRDDGICFLNFGDSYASQGGAHNGRADNQSGVGAKRVHNNGGGDSGARQPPPSLKPKDLCMMPARVALALQADGWYLRSDIIWAKGSPMPESVTDRPTKSHEHIFLLAKNAKYFYDADAVREPLSPYSTPQSRPAQTPSGADGRLRNDEGRLGGGSVGNSAGRNKRDVWHAEDLVGQALKAAKKGDDEAALDALRELASYQSEKPDVWHVNTKGFAQAHFAVFPPKLIEPCILAGSAAQSCSECGAAWKRVVEKGEPVVSGNPRGTAHSIIPNRQYQDVDAFMVRPSTTIGFRPTCDCDAEPVGSLVLDPFTGSGTTGMVALQHGRRFVGTELSAEYCAMAEKRIRGATVYTGLFADVEEVDEQAGRLF